MFWVSVHRWFCSEQFKFMERGSTLVPFRQARKELFIAKNVLMLLPPKKKKKILTWHTFVFTGEGTHITFTIEYPHLFFFFFYALNLHLPKPRVVPNSRGMARTRPRQPSVSPLDWTREWLMKRQAAAADKMRPSLGDEGRAPCVCDCGGCVLLPGTKTVPTRQSRMNPNEDH